MIRLRAFGYPSIERDGRPVNGAAAQRRVLALLVLVAASRGRGISRDVLLAMLWSEATAEKARQALTQALYHARRSLGEDEMFVSAAQIRVNPIVCSFDVWDFEDALDRGDHARAVELCDSPFLDGFFVNDAPEFERWCATERTRHTARVAHSLEQLASASERTGDLRTAVHWRRRRAALDPLDSAAACAAIRAMAAAGDRTGALRAARIHETLVRQELDVAPDPAVLELATRLRREADRERDGLSPLVGNPHPRATAVSLPNVDATGARSSGIEDGPPERPFVSAPLTSPEDGSRAIPPARPPSRHANRRARRVVAAAGLLLFGAGVLTLGRAVARPPDPVSASNLIVVSPFRVSGADPSLAFLREGLVDLIAGALSDDGKSRVADPAVVVAAWRASRETSAPSRDSALTIARRIGGERLLVGSVVGNPLHMILSASLLDVSNAAVKAQASAEGPSDSLTSVINRLVTRLIAGEAGVADRLRNHTTTSLHALRLYLDGQSAYRRGSNRNALEFFRRALDADSLFAMAGLGLAQAADRMNARTDVARGLAAAWRHRDELVERDLAYLQALAGPRYPAPSGGAESLAAWERATAVNPDRAEVWVGLGKQLFYTGRLLGIQDADDRAAAAFRRAADLDTAFASPLQFMLLLAAARGDTTEVARAERSYLRLDSLADLAPFLRWRAAVARGDSERLTALRRAFPTMSTVSLRTLALSSLYAGVEGHDAERAIALIKERTSRAADRADLLLAEHALALNRGEFFRAMRALEALKDAQPLSRLPDRLRVLDALYEGSDTVVAIQSAMTLAREIEGIGAAGERHTSTASAPNTTPLAEDVCVAGQWSAWKGSSEETQRAVAELTMMAREDGDPTPTVCSALLRAILGVREHSVDADTRLLRLDTLLLKAPPVDALLGYANLALARLYALHGNSELANRAARRRQHLDAWPSYLAAQFRERGRLAALVGDTATAVRAYRQFLATRSGTNLAVRDEVQAIRRELQRLTGSS